MNIHHELMRRRVMILTTAGAALGLACPLPALALVVYDPTNWLQNLMQARQAIQQVMHAKAQLDQIRGLGMQVENILNGRIKPNAIIGAEVANIRGYAQLYQGLGDVQRLVQARLSEAKLGKLTWAEYWNREKNRTGEDAQVAARRAEQERVALERVEEDFKWAKDQEMRISGAQTQSESLRTLNYTMNRVVQQNAEMIKLLATINGADKAEQQIRASERRAALLERRNNVRDAQNAANDAQRACADQMTKAANEAKATAKAASTPTGYLR